jgi:hypothetical protein
MSRLIFLCFSALAAFVAVLLVGSLWVPALAIPSLPLCWPGVLILGMDETTEWFGQYGEITVLWLASLPWIYFCSLVASRWIGISKKSVVLAEG